MTSYLRGNVQNGNVHLAQILTLGWNISRTIWRIEVNDGFIFFDQSFTLKSGKSEQLKTDFDDNSPKIAR